MKNSCSSWLLTVDLCKRTPAIAIISHIYIIIIIIIIVVVVVVVVVVIESFSVLSYSLGLLYVKSVLR